MADVDDDVWWALADPTRREVVDLLRSGPRRAGELAARVGVSGPALSRHLRVLRETGVVAVEFAEDDARGRSYSLREEPFLALQAWLDQVHAFWGEQLGAFADHVRATASAPASESPRAPGGQGGATAPARAAQPRGQEGPADATAGRSRPRRPATANTATAKTATAKTATANTATAKTATARTAAQPAARQPSGQPATANTATAKTATARTTAQPAARQASGQPAAPKTAAAKTAAAKTATARTTAQRTTAQRSARQPTAQPATAQRTTAHPTAGRRTGSGRRRGDGS